MWKGEATVAVSTLGKKPARGGHRTGPAGDQDDARLASDARVALRRVASALLVAYTDVHVAQSNQSFDREMRVSVRVERQRNSRVRMNLNVSAS